MNQVKVSVIVLSYNQGEFITQCLNSILAQKFSGQFEILVHDDLSTDHSRKIIDTFVMKYPNTVKAIYPDYNTFRTGPYKIITENILPVCNGDYFMFCEADDYWTDDRKIEKQLMAIQSDSTFSACVHVVNLIDACDGHKLYGVPNKKIQERYGQKIISEQFVYDWIDESCFFAFNSVMIKKEVIPAIIPEFFKVSYCMDYTIMLLAGVRGNICFLNETMGDKRVGNVGSFSYIAKNNASKHRLIDNLNMDILCLKKFDKFTNGKYSIQITNTVLKRLRTKFLLENRSRESWFVKKCKNKMKYYVKNHFRTSWFLCKLYLSIENIYLKRQVASWKLK